MTKYAASVLLGLLSLPLSAADLTIASFGGAYGDYQQRHMITPFAQGAGFTTRLIDFNGGTLPIEAQIKAGKIDWDVINIEGIDLPRACAAGLLAQLPPRVLRPGSDGVAATADFLPQAIASPCGVATIMWSVVYAYNHESMGSVQPLTMADFFDTQKFPGKRAMRKRPQVNLEWALMADGVKPAEVYRVLATAKGQARAYAKLSSIKDDIVWFDGWSDVPALLDSGQVVLAQSANARVYGMIKSEAKPLSIVWDGNVYDMDSWAVVKGSPNEERAIDFIAAASATEPLAAMAGLGFSAMRASANRLIAADVLPDLPVAHAEEGLLANGPFWARHGARLNQGFERWLNQ